MFDELAWRLPRALAAHLPGFHRTEPPRRSGRGRPGAASPALAPDVDPCHDPWFAPHRAWLGEVVPR